MKKLFISALLLSFYSSAALAKSEEIVLAGGCFWGMEAVFEHVKGVSDVVSGYAGGEQGTASYDQVSDGDTGHAEAVKVTYDPAQLSVGQLLDVYFKVAHNPTQPNFQGPDHGTQYRSEIFYENDAQKQVAEKAMRDLTAAKTYGNPIVTKVEPLKAFFPAEDYHQNFFDKHPNHPYIIMHDKPKVEKLAATFPYLYKE